MRYQKGIEAILRILHEFDGRTKRNMRCSTTLIGRKLGRNKDPASLGHLIASATALFKLKNETFIFLSKISKINMADSDVDRKPSTTHT